MFDQDFQARFCLPLMDSDENLLTLFRGMGAGILTSKLSIHVSLPSSPAFCILLAAFLHPVCRDSWTLLRVCCPATVSANDIIRA